MKSNLLTAVSLISCISLSSNSMANNYIDEKDITQFGYYKLLDMCGTYERVGDTSVFESINEYEKYYPRIGQLLAEIESIPALSAVSKQYAISTSSEAKEKTNLVYSTSSDIKFFKNRNAKYINATPELYESSMTIYGDSIAELQGEFNYVSSKAVDNMTNQLGELSTAANSTNSSNGPGSYNGYGITDLNIHSICISWWESGMPYLLTPEERESPLSRPRSKEGFKYNEPTKEKYLSHSYNKRDVEIGDYDAGVDVHNNVNSSFSDQKNSYNEYSNSSSNIKGIENNGWQDFIENTVVPKKSSSDYLGDEKEKYRVKEEYSVEKSYSGKEDESNSSNWWDSEKENNSAINYKVQEKGNEKPDKSSNSSYFGTSGFGDSGLGISVDNSTNPQEKESKWWLK